MVYVISRYRLSTAICMIFCLNFAIILLHENWIKSPFMPLRISQAHMTSKGAFLKKGRSAKINTCAKRDEKRNENCKKEMAC